MAEERGSACFFSDIARCFVGFFGNTAFGRKEIFRFMASVDCLRFRAACRCGHELCTNGRERINGFSRMAFIGRERSSVAEETCDKRFGR